MKLLLRSMLFVSANNSRFIEKSLTADADALIMDMEDAVPEDQKQLARDILKEYIDKGVFKGKKVFVRTNSLDSSNFIKDVDVSIHEDITGLMPPKIQSRDDIIFLDKLLSQKENEYGIKQGHFKLAPLIETTAAVLNLSEIIKDAPRLVAIAFGGGDFLDDLHGPDYKDGYRAFATPRALIAMAARSAGISPIDTPHLDLKDIEGFKKEKEEAYQLGFAGSLLINPKQIEPAHECFTPDAEEIERSRAIIEAIKESKKNGTRCVMLGENMIGPPLQRRSERIMKFVELLEAKDAKK